jgi:hypothetical protein
VPEDICEERAAADEYVMSLSVGRSAALRDVRDAKAATN